MVGRCVVVGGLQTGMAVVGPYTTWSGGREASIHMRSWWGATPLVTPGVFRRTGMAFVGSLVKLWGPPQPPQTVRFPPSLVPSSAPPLTPTLLLLVSSLFHPRRNTL